MNSALDFVALIASCLSLLFIVRAKKTYFLDTRFFMALATVGFIFYIGEAAYSDILDVAVSVPIDAVLIGVMGSSIGIASYLLKSAERESTTGKSALIRFISTPPKGFLVFMVATWTWTLAGILTLKPENLQTGTLGSPGSYYIYPNWFIAASTLLLASFIGLPVLSFYRQSRTIREKTASLSMKIISTCWAMFGLSVFFQIVGGEFLQAATQSIGFVVDSFLFVLISFALREPTVLARIITAGEVSTRFASSETAADTIILYNTESNRSKMVETFIKNASATGQRTVLRVAKSEVPFYRAVLSSRDLLVPSGEGRDVTILPLETSSTISSKDSTSDNHSVPARELVDLDELGLERCKEMIERIIASDTSAENRRVGRIWALNTDGAQEDVVSLLTEKFPGSKRDSLAGQQDVFSSLLGLTHQDILGNRLLLEYDPTSDYEQIVEKFVREFQANVEAVSIFTNAGSPLYRQFNQQRNVGLFSFSTKTSTPARISNEQVLLPERDTSLLLDAVDKLLQAHTGRQVGIVIDVFTYLILSLGFEKAYGVISSVVEMAETEPATILVLINSEALESRTISGIRGLFQSQIVFDSNGLKLVRLTSDEPGKSRTLESLTEPRELSGKIQL